MRTLMWISLFFGFLFLISSLQPCMGHWVPEDGWKMHYPQNPDPRGWDVCFRRIAVADDFECIESGAVTDIHFWISWKNDLVDEVLGWTISIYSDANSQPGRELWRFKKGRIELRKEQPSLQGWLCPCMNNETDRVIPDNHTWYALVNITEIEEPFIQKESEVYWLVIRANATLYESPRPQPEVGWKTSIDAWGSPALWRPWPLSSTDAWRPVISPDATSIRPHNMAFVINGKDTQVLMDFGDVEETRCDDTNSLSRCNSYPTTLARNGARHIINPGIFLGSPYTDVIHIDAEPDGQPSHLADGDDNNGADDEDGVLFDNLPLVPGTKATVNVFASVDGFLDAWIDFNADGDWDDFGERIFFSEPLKVGENTLAFEVPLSTADYEQRETYARFRFSTYGRLNYYGPARDGEVEDYRINIASTPHPKLDYGDAPDGDFVPSGYPTLRINDGARHKINPRVRLGRYIDGERDGQPTIAADGDDINLIDDEDGVFFRTPIIPGTTVEIKVIASVDGFLNAWIDFDYNRNWDGAAEQIFIDEPLVAGINRLKFAVPAASVIAVNTRTYSRFRFTTKAVKTGYSGLAEDGEVEDYIVKIEPPQPEFDFGDVPELRCEDSSLARCNTYPTTLARNGARHIVDPKIYLGRAIDAEWDGQPTLAADGDDLDSSIDDEDGVIFITPIVPGLIAKVEVIASVEGRLDAWIDFNADGDWDDFGEQIFAGEPLAAGINYLKYQVPCYPYAVAADVRTYARFRFSTQGRLRYGGPARDGEVEDYLVKIEDQPQRTADLGDAPDSTSNFNVDMTAYTSVGPLPVVVKANYATVYLTGSPPYGPIHWYPDAVAHLGGRVSLETEADFGYDEDPTNNIIPPKDLPNMDLADDGVKIPLNLPHCRRTRFDYIVTVIHPIDELYVNVWFDWNRDGDWDDVMDCGIANEITNKARGLAREWAVRNQVLTNLPAGIHKITTPAFLPYHPFRHSDDVYRVDPIWMRITISERPWGPVAISPTPAAISPVIDCVGYGGSGPKGGYKIGETEDYFFVPTTRCIQEADLNCSRAVDFTDFATFASQWLADNL